jgi:hypothetical protein
MSTGVSNVLKQNANEVERTLLAVSAEVARNVVGKTEEMSTVLGQRAAELTQIVDEKSSGLLAALTGRSEEFVSEEPRTEQAVKAIESRGLNFTESMMDNSAQIARLISEASETATGAVNQSLKEPQTSHIAASETTASGQPLDQGTARNRGDGDGERREDHRPHAARLQDTTQTAVEQSKQSASSAVSEMQETQNMLRSDATALYERLREGNILLQEVLTGAHENMSGIESTLVARVSDFVAVMNDVAQKAGATNSDVERQISAFQAMSVQATTDLSQLAGQFDAHGRSLAEAVALIDTSNRRTEGALAERTGSLDELVATLDDKATISSSGSRALPACSTSRWKARRNAREIAASPPKRRRAVPRRSSRISRRSQRAEDERQRLAGHAEHLRAGDGRGACDALCSGAALHRRARRIEADDVGMQHEPSPRAASCARAFSSCRARRRRAQMRASSSIRSRRWRSSTHRRPPWPRPRRGRACVARRWSRPSRARGGWSRPSRLRAGAAAPRGAARNGGPRGELARQRADITGVAAPPIPARRAEAPALSPGQPGGGRTGWLSSCSRAPRRRPRPR